MRKIMAIAGEPGTGKTTLMWSFIRQYVWETREEVKLVNTLYNKEKNLYILGKYEEGETFSGTDRYSMAVQPSAIEFIKNNESNILFEGDRLTNNKFYDFLLDLPNTEVQFLIVTANKNTLSERYKTRNSNQSETFLKGRKTKIDNILSNFCYMDYRELVKNEDIVDQQTILEKINKFFS